VLRGKTIQDAKDLFLGFHELVTGDGTAESVPKKLSVFSGVREFPMRVKCATLSWHTLIAAIDGNKEASTE
jgi:nitrogen fixation NifU-like protein